MIVINAFFTLAFWVFSLAWNGLWLAAWSWGVSWCLDTLAKAFPRFFPRSVQLGLFVALVVVFALFEIAMAWVFASAARGR